MCIRIDKLKDKNMLKFLTTMKEKKTKVFNDIVEKRIKVAKNYKITYRDQLSQQEIMPLEMREDKAKEKIAEVLEQIRYENKHKLVDNFCVDFYVTNTMNNDINDFNYWNFKENSKPQSPLVDKSLDKIKSHKNNILKNQNNELAQSLEKKLNATKEFKSVIIADENKKLQNPNFPKITNTVIPKSKHLSREKFKRTLTNSSKVNDSNMSLKNRMNTYNTYNTLNTEYGTSDNILITLPPNSKTISSEKSQLKLVTISSEKEHMFVRNDSSIHVLKEKEKPNYFVMTKVSSSLSGLDKLGRIEKPRRHLKFNLVGTESVSTKIMNTDESYKPISKQSSLINKDNFIQKKSSRHISSRDNIIKSHNFLVKNSNSKIQIKHLSNNQDIVLIKKSQNIIPNPKKEVRLIVKNDLAENIDKWKFRKIYNNNFDTGSLEMPLYTDLASIEDLVR